MVEECQQTAKTILFIFSFYILYGQSCRTVKDCLISGLYFSPPGSSTCIDYGQISIHAYIIFIMLKFLIINNNTYNIKVLTIIFLLKIVLVSIWTKGNLLTGIKFTSRYSSTATTATNEEYGILLSLIFTYVIY